MVAAYSKVHESHLRQSSFYIPLILPRRLVATGDEFEIKPRLAPSKLPQLLIEASSKLGAQRSKEFQEDKEVKNEKNLKSQSHLSLRSKIRRLGGLAGSPIQAGGVIEKLKDPLQCRPKDISNTRLKGHWEKKKKTKSKV
ncbi:hypothetical protein IEQ34_001632 [Dendrobium chrysotoxum]|uniref:Uncharacterized protein n=1 Tax=Dendrobium chrysotoxum TaxID=161865 RepID=A0AAV7HQL5_DENCH|nr:hypothetical protein IEQ34_001632 [Dendrobium chrysotoxum]